MLRFNYYNESIVPNMYKFNVKKRFKARDVSVCAYVDGKLHNLNYDKFKFIKNGSQAMVPSGNRIFL